MDPGCQKKILEGKKQEEVEKQTYRVKQTSQGM
jgi:hypothetical protein